MNKFLPLLLVAGVGLLVGTLFGFLGSAISGISSFRTLGPVVGMLSAFFAWKAANKK